MVGNFSNAATDNNQDVVALLLLIQGHCCQFDEHQQGTWALEQEKHRVPTYYQCHNISNMDYLKNFQALVGMVETYGGAYGQEPGLIWAHLIAKNMANPDKPSSTELEAAKKACCEEYLLCMFLRRADQTR